MGCDQVYDVVAVVDDLLRGAASAGASDVHFEPTGKGLVIKYRLDGALSIVEELPQTMADNVISRLKVLGGLLTYRNDIPQEGRIDRLAVFPASRARRPCYDPRAGSPRDRRPCYDSRAGSPRDRRPCHAADVTDQRLAVFPTIHGQRAVVRFFYEEKSLVDLDELGLPEVIGASLKQIAAASQGLLLLTGPAGSGKSTTLAAMLRYILRKYPGKSVVTLEDPVERRIEGITQVQISPHGRMTFPVALRSLLRQDPEVLMIGEIRDAETVGIAIEAALTGHLLMSTMHSGTPAGALLRMLEMGIEPYQVTSSVSAVLNQRLIRKICEHCGRPEGCERCFNTGFRGRMLIAEFVRLDGELRKAVLDRADADTLEEILGRRGHMNMFQNGMRLVNEGLTTQAELNRVCGLEEETGE